MPGLIWDGTSSFGSGEAELKYFNGVLSFFLCPFDFILMLQMFLVSVVGEFLWNFLMKFPRGGNLRECSGFRVRGISLHWKLVVLCLRQGVWFLIVVIFVVQFLGLKPTGSSGLLGKGLWSLGSIACILGGLLRTQIIRLASLSHSSLLPAPFSFSILEVHRVSPMVILSLSVARVKEMVTALSVSLGEEGKHRPFYLSIGGSPRRASGELSLYRWLSETMKNTIAAAEANRKVDRSRGMRHDPG
ncbi:hypothetical protein YC2023_117789 [Brassica napus]